MTMTPYYINSASPLGLSHLNFFSVIFFTDFSVFSYFVNLQTIQLVINNIALHLSFQSRALIHSYNNNFFYTLMPSLMGVTLLEAQAMLFIVSWRHYGLPLVLMSTISIDTIAFVNILWWASSWASVRRAQVFALLVW